MAGNVPAGNPNNLSVGSCRVYMGALGATPTTDFGYIGDAGVTVDVAVTLIDILQGTPATKIRSFVGSKDVTIEFTSLEVLDLGKLRGIFGGNYTTGTTTVDESWDITVDPCVTSVALRLTHDIPCTTNEKLYIDAFNFQPSGAFALAFTSSEPLSVPVAGSVIPVGVDWAGVTNADNNLLLRVTRVTP